VNKTVAAVELPKYFPSTPFSQVQEFFHRIHPHPNTVTMADSPKENKKPAPLPSSPLREYEGDTPMTDASPLNTVQGSRTRPSPADTPVRAPRTSLSGHQYVNEYIATPRNSRSSSTSSTGGDPIVPTPGMVPRSRTSINTAGQRTPTQGAAQPLTPYPGTDASTPGLPAMSTMTPGTGISSLASSSSFRSSVLAGERPMPETPAQATTGTPKEMPERRRSTRFRPRDSVGVITPTNPTHRRASALFQSQSDAAREADAVREADAAREAHEADVAHQNEVRRRLRSIFKGRMAENLGLASDSSKSSQNKEVEKDKEGDKEEDEDEEKKD
ncbi:uncharacterized protein GGS22DRAFT_194812, partial [Annulohypoxylon maeteangense]|uniref:uncharacterized protein n=1 Tax=Annulohypoxylon maeteangense TaxID=1927788 RepID=UPI0020080601